MMARVYAFPIDQPAHPSRTMATIATQLNAALRHVRRSRIRCARVSLAAPATELHDIALAIQAVRDRLLELAADSSGAPRAAAGRPAAGPVARPRAESGDTLTAAASALESGIAHINNLAQAWMPVAPSECPREAVDELRLLVCALADIRANLLDVHRETRAGGGSSAVGQLRE
jgi:hypothetical protein